MKQEKLKCGCILEIFAPGAKQIIKQCEKHRDNKGIGIDEAIENESEKITRPDYSFITKCNFKSMDSYVKWRKRLTEEEKRILYLFQSEKIPALIQCAEMLFDLTEKEPNSIVFKMVSETLNVK